MTDIAVTDNCKNPDSYGEICVKCNKCGRFGEQEMTREEAIKELQDLIDYSKSTFIKSKPYINALEMAISTLECGKMLEVCYDQVKQERDIAIEQLKELGYELGQKIEPCEDAISREQALKVASDECLEFRGIYGRIESRIRQLPSVQPSRKDNIECEWAKMVNDTEITPRRIEFEFSDGTRKRVLYTEEVIKHDMRGDTE